VRTEGRIPLAVEAMATGFFLGTAQVALGFSILAGAGASALRFFALTAAWIAGAALGVLGGGRGGPAFGIRLLAASLLGVASARAALIGAPFHDASSAAGLLAGALTGAYAGSFLGERAPAWGDVRALLLHENNGFLAGFASAWALLFASARALDRSLGVLGIVLLAARLAAWRRA